MSSPEAAARTAQLLDAIDLIESGQRKEALPLLRGLIQQDSNFEDAWLWMSVAVDSLDQAIVCLDNVLRINPENEVAAAALYQLRKSEIASEQLRDRYRYYRDLAFVGLWLLIIGLMFAMFISSFVTVLTATTS